MFRIACRNTQKDHPDSAIFAVGRTYDEADEAKAALPDVAKVYRKADGYELSVEELVQKGEKSSWEEVS